MPSTRPAARLRRAAAVVLSVVLLPLGACGDGGTGPNEAETVTGSWTGTITEGGASAVLAFTAAQTDGQVSGTGTLSAGGETLPLTLTGTVVQPDVSLTFQSAGFEPVIFSGTLAAATMTGTLEGSGFTGQPLTLTRVSPAATPEVP